MDGGTQAHTQRFELSAIIAGATPEEQFTTVYQPVFTLKLGEVLRAGAKQEE
jgi:hypothetical protein